MFDRYTEKARRMIFFARCEASRYGSPSIETEHILLALVREDRALMTRFLGESDFESEIRTEIERRITARERIPTSVDVPLTAESSQILDFAGEEADRLGQRSSGLKRHGSEELLPFFAKNAHFVDASGRVWNREEIGKHFETLFILYAKKNAAYVIEGMVQDTKDIVVAVALWKNAIFASMERVWMHRMSIILVPEGEEWTIALLQMTPVKPA